MKYFNLKWVKFDSNTKGGLMCVTRILNWGTWDPGNIDIPPLTVGGNPHEHGVNMQSSEQYLHAENRQPGILRQ